MAVSAKVTVVPEQIALRPGAMTDVEVTIQNATSVVEHFATSLIGLTGEHSSEADPPVVKLRPKEVGTVRLRISIPERMGPVAGRYTLGVLVRSPYQQAVSRCEELVLDVEEAPDLAMEVQPALVTAGRTARYDMSLRNDGNMPLQVTFTGRDQENDVGFTFDPRELTLQPGAGAYARATASARRPMTGQDQRRSMSITAAAGQLTVERPVAFAQKPVIRGGVLRVSGIAAGLAALVGATIGGALLIRGAVGGDEDDPQNAGNPGASAPANPGEDKKDDKKGGEDKKGEDPDKTGEPSQPKESTPPADSEDPPGAIFADFTNPPDGPPGDRLVSGDLYKDKGIALAALNDVAAPTCFDATAVALRRVTQAAPFGTYLTSARPGSAEKCNTQPVRITFADGATFVRVNFTGLTDQPYTLTVQLSDGSKKNLEKTIAKDGEETKVTFEADEGVTIDNVAFGPTDPLNPKGFTVLKGVAHVPVEK